jgi:hypothetical protein
VIFGCKSVPRSVVHYLAHAETSVLCPLWLQNLVMFPNSDQAIHLRSLKFFKIRGPKF